jgi:hypothetical protein
MYDMDLCKDYVEIPEEMATNKMWWCILGLIRLDGRVWCLMYETHGKYFDWFEVGEDWDFDGDFWYHANNLIDRHYLEKAHGESFGSTVLQNGAL